MIYYWKLKSEYVTKLCLKRSVQHLRGSYFLVCLNCLLLSVSGSKQCNLCDSFCMLLKKLEHNLVKIAELLALYCCPHQNLRHSPLCDLFEHFISKKKKKSDTPCTDLFLSFVIFRHFQPRFDIYSFLNAKNMLAT